MTLSHPVLLGLIWSLLILIKSGQSQISNVDSNKVYAYAYHFQHNGTTNSRDILRSVLGSDAEFGLGPDDGKSIVKTFSSPSIRGFFTKGVLPAGPISQNSNTAIHSPYAVIRRIVENNLQPPPEVATGLLPPISPDISREYNGVNHIENLFQNQDDFPKIPPPPPIANNIGGRNIESFSRDTPDGGKIVGQVERFSYNPPPVSNSISRTDENSEGFRRRENILNNNREITGHRTQSYFRQHFRTVSPNLESNNFNQNNRVDSRHPMMHNNNQWWNGLNVLGPDSNNLNLPPKDINNHVKQNLNEIQNNINRAFGARLSGFRRYSNQAGQDNGNRQNIVNPNIVNHFNQNQNLKNPLQNRINNPVNNNQHFPNVPNVPFSHVQGENINRNVNNKDFSNIPNPNFNVNNNRDFSNIPNPNFNVNNNKDFSNIPNPNFNVNNNLPNINPYSNHQAHNNVFHNNPIAIANNELSKQTEKQVMNLLENVRSHLNNLQVNNEGINNIGPTWDDDPSRNVNQDWSSRRPNLNRRPFSNGHSGPSNGHQPADVLRRTFDSLMGNRNFDIPGNQGGNYRNVDGGGVEKVINVDKIVEGPNSFSRNQQRRYERNFRVNSNTGYSRANQWSSNSVRRLDAQSSKPDFSKDFIDVFREEK